jgi:hypothetical protein
MKTRIPPAVCAITACLGLVLATGPTFAHSPLTGTTTDKTIDKTSTVTRAGAAGKATSFAFKGSGFGTRIVGGQAPGASDTTAYQAIGCTTMAGKQRVNDDAEATVPGLGTLTDSKTRVWTTSRHGVVASHATHSIAKIVLASTGVGSLSIDGIRSTSTVRHDSTGFHPVTSTQIGSLVLTPPIGPPQSFPAPTPDQPVTIPGLATLYAGKSHTSHSATSAEARAVTLRIDVVASGSSIRIAHSRAELDSGVTDGVFGGHSAAVHVVSAAGDIVKGGPQPLNLMPCQGTYGKVLEKRLATLDLGGQLLTSDASTRGRAVQGAHRAHGYERAQVGKFDLAGQLLIKNIVAKASVTRTAHGVVKSAKGTQLGSVTANGQTQKFPKTGVLEIPGVAKLERAVVTRSHSGISVIGLRITLLDGSGAVIDLAEAKLRIRPTGR